MPANVEIKARAADPRRQRELAAGLSDAPPEVIRQEDFFFRAPGGRLKLRVLGPRRGELIYYRREDRPEPKPSEYFIAATDSPGSLRRVLEEVLKSLPKGVTKVRLRSDTAGYQHDLLRYCDEKENKWCGRIEFAVGCDVTPEFKKAVLEIGEEDWMVLKKRERSGELRETTRQWAEVCFVPNAIGRSKKGLEYRYLAIRERMQDQLMLPGMEEEEKGLPFQTMRKAGVRYKVFGIVTNMDWDGQALIEWHYKRCGRSEQAHSVMKEDLAGGTLPSGDFGENAAWWWIMGCLSGLTVSKQI